VDRLSNSATSASPLARLGLGWEFCAGKIALQELRETPVLEAAELLW
jgi:hypothetical protein